MNIWKLIYLHGSKIIKKIMLKTLTTTLSLEYLILPSPLTFSFISETSLQIMSSGKYEYTQTQF